MCLYGRGKHERVLWKLILTNHYRHSQWPPVLHAHLTVYMGSEALVSFINLSRWGDQPTSLSSWNKTDNFALIWNLHFSIQSTNQRWKGTMLIIHWIQRYEKHDKFIEVINASDYMCAFTPLKLPDHIT